MWMMPLHLHVDQKLDYDDDNIFPGSNFMVQTTRCVVWGQDVFHINRYLVSWLHIRRYLTRVMSVYCILQPNLLRSFQVMCGVCNIRPPDKNVYWKTIFFISHPKHMFQLMGKKISTILRS